MKMSRKNTIMSFLKSAEFITIVIFIIMLSSVATLQGNFFKISTLQNTIISWTPLILLTIGQGIVIISGGLDMSSGNALSFLLCVLAGVMKKDNPGTGSTAILICFLCMLIIGLVNGVAVGYFKLPPLIATFATSYIWLGAALFIMPSPGGECVSWIRGFYKLSSVKNNPIWIKNFGKVIPTCVLLILLAVIIWTIISHTKIGRYIYATGSNRNIAYDSGVNTVKIQVIAYMLNSFFIMLAALFLVAQNQSGSARIGEPLTLQSVASAILGGIALSGGKGKVCMGIVGAATLSLVTKLIFFSGINNDYQTLVSGLILLVAVASSAIITVIKQKVAEKGEAK